MRHPDPSFHWKFAAEAYAELLLEWMDSPFFTSQEEWQQWRDNLARRINEAICRYGIPG